MLTSVLRYLLLHFTYYALGLILVAGGLGMPIPEDVPLIFSGYLCNPVESPLAPANAAAQHHAAYAAVPSAWIMFLAGMIGMLCGDTILYCVGRNGIDSKNFIAGHVRKVLHSKRRDKVEKYFARHGNLTLFIGRFVPGVRALVFALCGISKMPYLQFVAVDGLAGLISVPAFIFIGYHFAHSINAVFARLAEVKHYIYLAAIAAAVVGLVIFLLRKRSLRQKAAASQDKASAEHNHIG